MGGVCPVPRCGVWLGACRAHLRIFRPQEDALVFGAATTRFLVTCRIQVTYFTLQIKHFIYAYFELGFQQLCRKALGPLNNALFRQKRKTFSKCSTFQSERVWPVRWAPRGWRRFRGL